MGLMGPMARQFSNEKEHHNASCSPRTHAGLPHTSWRAPAVELPRQRACHCSHWGPAPSWPQACLTWRGRGSGGTIRSCGRQGNCSDDTTREVTQRAVLQQTLLVVVVSWRQNSSQSDDGWLSSSSEITPIISSAHNACVRNCNQHNKRLLFWCCSAAELSGVHFE